MSEPKLTLPEAAARLRACDRVLILTHKRPDGDTIGCAMAMCRMLRRRIRSKSPAETRSSETGIVPTSYCESICSYLLFSIVSMLFEFVLFYVSIVSTLFELYDMLSSFVVLRYLSFVLFWCLSLSRLVFFSMLASKAAV